MKKTLALLMSLLLATALFCGCGSSSKSSGSYAQDYYEPAYDDYEFAPAAMAEEAAYGMQSNSVDVPAEAPVPMPDTLDASRENGAKLIYTANLELETLEFDQAVSDLAALTAKCGGYYEQSSVTESGSIRRASYTVRVPAQNYRAFLSQVGELCHLLSLNEYTEDVSEMYYDTAGRLDTQRTKLSRLQALLAQAESMEDIITIENAISETEELIDRLSGTLRHYDALVDYSTVDIYLREVKVYEPEPDLAYGTRLGGAFQEGWQGFVSGMGDILVALAYSWLWLLLIAGVVALILCLTRKSRAAKKAERTERMAAKLTRNAAPPAVYSQPAKKDDE